MYQHRQHCNILFKITITVGAVFLSKTSTALLILAVHMLTLIGMNHETVSEKCMIYIIFCLLLR